MRELTNVERTTLSNVNERDLVTFEIESLARRVTFREDAGRKVLIAVGNGPTRSLGKNTKVYKANEQGRGRGRPVETARFVLA